MATVKLRQPKRDLFEMSTNNSEEEYRYAIFPDYPFGPIPNEGEDEQWHQIHFLFGQATLRAQAYEDGIARFVVAAEARWVRSGKTAVEVWKLTLGALQKEYCRYFHIEDHRRERMTEALRIRNSLAHNFYRRRMEFLGCAEGRNHVIRELHTAIDLFKIERDETYWNLSLINDQPLL